MSDSDEDSDINGSIYDPQDNLNLHMWLYDVSRRFMSNNDVNVDEEQTDRFLLVYRIKRSDNFFKKFQ